MTGKEPPSAKDLFLRTLETPREDRAAYLDAVCGSDSRLRSEVADLIRAREDAGDFFASPTTDVPPDREAF